MSDVILTVNDLVTEFDTEIGPVKAVDGLSFEVRKGTTFGIVGESGCGKSVSSLSIMRLLPKPAGRIVSGEVLLNDIDLAKLPSEKMRNIRGNRISMIFQEPMTALNPVHRIGKQMVESYALHNTEKDTAEKRAVSLEMLRKVGIPDPEQRFRDYPHQLSGGMRQRVMIAMALICQPEILIADEPTTALDVTIQAQILDLMKSLQAETGMSIIFITHDLGVIAEMCDEVVVMYAGNMVESAAVMDLFQKPKHPYTKGLLKSIPRLEYPAKEKLATIEGVVPDLTDLPIGCRFQNRCEYADSECAERQPPVEIVGQGHTVRCFKWRQFNE